MVSRSKQMSTQEWSEFSRLSLSILQSSQFPKSLYQSVHPWKLTWLAGKCPIFNRNYIDSIMVDFPASHVSELGGGYQLSDLNFFGKSQGCFIYGYLGESFRHKLEPFANVTLWREDGKGLISCPCHWASGSTNPNWFVSEKYWSKWESSPKHGWR